MNYSAVLLNSIIEHAIDGIITINKRGVIESINPSACKLFGYPSEEVIGKNISVLMPSPHKQHHDAYLERYQKTREAHDIGIGREVTGLRKDGSTFPSVCQSVSLASKEIPFIRALFMI